MINLKIKKHLENYVRDSYIGEGDLIRKKYNILPEEEINCELGTYNLVPMRLKDFVLNYRKIFINYLKKGPIMDFLHFKKEKRNFYVIKNVRGV